MTAAQPPRRAPSGDAGPRLRVLAAMSGGVDSAVAAARMVDAGHDVTGVHLALSPSPALLRDGARGCCSVEDSRDARRAADVLGIPFYVWDLAERFREDVVEDFLAEYAAGRTPNPCVRCNERIKFAAVLDRALALGFDVVATGHYARLDDGVLRRAVDPAKDQSYVLGVLTPEQLAHAVLPLGASLKSDVRVEAAARGLLVADKPDSHDVCFIPDGDTAGFLRRRLGAAPGPVRDLTGATVGAHEGAYAFTVGQRRGLGLATPAADGEPRYVLEVSPAARTVTVGPREALDVTGLDGEHLRWCGPTPQLPAPVLVQVRAHGEAVAATASWLVAAPAQGASPEADGDRAGLRLELAQPLRGVAPGQSAVLYDGDRVLGSVTVRTAHRPG